MGSRFNVYLFDDINKCYGITRGGYKSSISKTIFEPLLTRLRPYMQENNIKMMIIDCELMPWSKLSKNMIIDQFNPIPVALTETSKWLKNTGFVNVLENLNKQAKTLNKKSYELYKNMLNNYVPPSELDELSMKYTEQLNIYTKDETEYLKPFDILKIVFNDNTEVIPGINNTFLTKNQCFKIVNDDECLLLDLNNDFDNNLKLLNIFFDKKDMEGIIVRPNIIDINSNVSPYMKVRNKEYLRLVYGYDYLIPAKYSSLLKNKSINVKTSLCIEQFKLGVKMLSINYNDIDKKTFKIKKYLQQMETSINTHVDPRL